MVFLSQYSPIATLALAAAAVVTISSLPHVVNAHGYIEVPASTFLKGTTYPSEWIVQFSPPWDGDFSKASTYATVSKEKGYTTLRSYIENKGALCGKTDPNATTKAIPSDNTVVFSRAIVHPGPCELWLDDTRVMQDDDCEATFGSAIPKWKIDFSSCTGKTCMLRWFWLGLQNSGQLWQVYKNCVPLTGTGTSSSTATASDADTVATTTPTPTTKTPNSTTKTPTSTTKTPTTMTATPKPTKTPKATKTPKSTSTSKSTKTSKGEVGGDADTDMSAASSSSTMAADVKCKVKRT